MTWWIVSWAQEFPRLMHDRYAIFVVYSESHLGFNCEVLYLKQGGKSFGPYHVGDKITAKSNLVDLFTVIT